MKPSIIRLRALEKQLFAYRYALNTIDFDAETVAPEGSADGRAEACEVLSRASFELLVNADTAALLQQAAAEAETEQEQAERMRREFTANVSHELKTPLQAIIGSAELIENGLVKPEDMPRFVGHIHSEASRLMALISDIIRLSQLDEGEEMPRESVDLYDEAAEAEENLRTAAEEKGVKLSLTGEGAEISGVRRLVYEIIYNLCDNAIKYNRTGGSVEVRVTQSESEAAVTVADTGIGIAPEDQARVFERFYRADKSRSKESGGTGLGLSIVKHAVQYHHGSIDLKSTPGEGTTIKVTFPK